MANMSETDQAIDKRETALWTTIFATFDKNNWVNFVQLTKNVRDLYMYMTYDLEIQ